MSPIISDSCLKPPFSSRNGHYSSSTSQGYSTDFTPSSSTSVRLSPTVNLSREYTLALQTNSYSEIRRIFYREGAQIDQECVSDSHEEHLNAILQPGPKLIEEALSQIKPSPLTKLIASYFDHSEHTSRLCLALYQSIHRARALYGPIHDLLDDIISSEFESSDGFSLSYSQCQSAFDLFLRFDRNENPFPSQDMQSFEEMRTNFSQLRLDLDHHVRKSKSRIKAVRNCSTGSAYCLIASVVGITVSAVIIATHAIVALVAVGPFCPAIVSSCNKIGEREMVRLAQLNAASKGTYVLQNDLNTIDRLVARLYSAVENDRLLIRLGLARDFDRYSVKEIVKQLVRNRSSFVKQISDLEEHIFLCFAAINRARALLLQEIYLHYGHG